MELPPLITEWKSFLVKEFESSYFSEIMEFLDKEETAGFTVYPEKKNIFTAFNLTKPKDLKVVIIGQDPYHGPNQAHGLCFSVLKGITPPPSLVNIYKELKSDIGFHIPNHGELSNWASQGVLMLNATLTVRANQAGSHQKAGWEVFTNAVIKELSSRFEGLIFLLWGRFAQSKKEFIDENKHFVLEAAHPSPFSATKFFGCKHFSKTNEILKSLGRSPIDWAIKD